MRRALKGLAIFLLLLVAAILAGRAYLRGSLPQLEGTVQVSGISGPVDIIRDRDAVTHVFAATRLDTFYGLGYAHAQDRLWQMEFQRRVGHGRLFGVVGPASLNNDRFLCTLGTGRAAGAAWSLLAEQTKKELETDIVCGKGLIRAHPGKTP